MDSLQSEIQNFFQLGLLAANPHHLFPDFWKDHPKILQNLKDNSKNIHVFALGKAAYSMATAFTAFIKVKEVWILTKYGHIPEGIKEKETNSNWHFRESAHPVPDENSILHTKEIIEALQLLSEDDRLVVLLSGGGSSLFEIPAEGYTLKDLKEIQFSLLNKGIPIQELNSERKKYSQVKGGKFLNLLNQKLEVYTFAISDVLGDDPNVIASGPTYPSPNYFLLGNLTHSLSKILNLAKSKGWKTKLLSDTWAESSEETSLLFENEFLEAIKSPEKQMILLGGELVCPVMGNGKGGRNLETALRVSILLQKHKTNRSWVFLSGGTDGTDGPTDSAGGLVDQDSYQKMVKKGWDPMKELLNSNSYPILKDIGSTLETGPTGTNVNDLLLLLVAEAET
ncbi:glycerate kinase type-2 family protein [Leptospira jelokensis]|uniref:glycerate kinase type-2 family protein n=1 Tax=Leptospira jelokensis TaxID=2484931 RepID=UPI0010916F0F|nr:DUF4147 domain-containing protein [Leptospira jelokensis]TGM05055.1 DUF4147 domain-containing protein [Leptospira jelokensis]